MTDELYIQELNQKLVAFNETLEDHYKPAVRDLHEYVERLETENKKLQQSLKELTPKDIREFAYIYNTEVTEKLKAADDRIRELEQHAKIRAALHEGDVGTLGVGIRELEAEISRRQDRIRELECEVSNLKELANDCVTCTVHLDLEARIEKAKKILERDVMIYVGGPNVQMRHALEALDGK